MSSRGIGWRIRTLVLRKTQVDVNKRTGELTEDEVKTVNDILTYPINYNIQKCFLDRHLDVVLDNNLSWFLTLLMLNSISAHGLMPTHQVLDQVLPFKLEPVMALNNASEHKTLVATYNSLLVWQNILYGDANSMSAKF